MAIDLNSIISLLTDDGSPEHWEIRNPQQGDHIRVRRLGGLYYHHGIYVSEEEVITFAGDDDYNPIDWWDTEIRATSLEEFRQGGVIEVRQYTEKEQEQLCPVPETIAFARACIGNKKYDLLFHNCEHFANACKLGVYRSHQTEQILLGKALPRALECLGDETQRETWLKEAYEDLKNQVLDKLRRDLDKSGPDQDV